MLGFTTIGSYAQKHTIVRPRQGNANAKQGKKPIVVKTKIYTPEAVDLGLSVKWASFNLGASSPEQTGYYYKWGETKPADKNGWATYKYARGHYDRLTKYNNDGQFGYKGYTDHRSKLESSDDAATANLGGKWRMPTDKEVDELMRKCKRERTTRNGKKGMLLTGPNGNSIFLPYAGYINYDRNYGPTYSRVGFEGCYWSNTLCGGVSSRYLIIDDNTWHDCMNNYRAYGYSVRPVLPK